MSLCVNSNKNADLNDRTALSDMLNYALSKTFMTSKQFANQAKCCLLLNVMPAITKQLLGSVIQAAKFLINGDIRRIKDKTKW